MMIVSNEKLEDDYDLQSKNIQSDFTKHPPASRHLMSSERREEEGLQLYMPLSSDH